MKQMLRAGRCTFLVGLLIMALGVMPAAAAPFAYVVHQFAATVSVIDLANNTVITTIPFGSPTEVTLTGVAAAPDGSHVYVAVQGNIPLPGNNVLAIATATNTVVATIPVDLGPYGVAVTPDGSRVYVACINGSGGGSVDVIDVASNAKVASISTDVGFAGRGPLAIAITPNGSRAYVTFLVSNPDINLGVIDTTTNQVIAYIDDTAPGYFGVAINPAGTQVYETNFADTSGVAVIDIATNTVIDRISTGSNSTGVAFTPDGSRAYVANVGSNFVSVIDTASRTVPTNILVGNFPRGVAITPDGSRAYVTVNSSNSVAVIDTASNVVVTTIPLTAAPYDIAIANPMSNVVTVAATDPTAAETLAGSDPGVFTITRSGDTRAALTVNFTVEGTATPGADYNAIVTAVTIPSGQASATVTITPILDALIEGNETVILTLASGTGYTVGILDTAMVTIVDYTGGLLGGPPSMNFGSVKVGSSKDRTVVIANGSQTASLVVKVNPPTPNPPFSLISGGGTIVIGPGLNHTVTIRFTPTGTGDATGTLPLNSTDPARPTVNIALSGTGK